MKPRIGICTNIGNCPEANSKRKVPLSGSDDACPSCGSRLAEINSATSSLATVFKTGVYLLLLGGGGFAGWTYLIPHGPSQTHLIPTSLEVTGDSNAPQLVRETNCLLDNPSPELQATLPMTSVGALTRFPIPRDLHAWMKNVEQVSQPAFDIMRREVTVAEFKRYVNTLPESEQDRLGTDWQQDRNGAPLPQDYPVGSITWEDAKGYVDWLAKETGCSLTLPTYAQWIAAAVQYAKPDQAMTRQHQQSQYLRPTQRPPVPDEVMDLLGNLREWVLDAGVADQLCPNGGHYILGEDYKTWLQEIGGEPRCETMGLDTVGFRVVRMK